MGNLLENLPTEILLPIITSLPDLDSLWKLLQASPRVWHLFEDASTSLVITEGILSGPHSTIPDNIRQLIRGVILVRSGTLPFEDLDEFGSRFMKAMIPCISDQPAVETLGPDSLSHKSNPAILRSVIATAYHLSALSQSYLASCLERLRDPSFRPLHAHNPSPHYTHDYKGAEGYVPAWDREFVGTPAHVVNIGQPTWVEEMRAVRVMWIIQLVGEMQLLGSKSNIGWSEEDVSRLLDMDPVDLFHEPGSPICDTEPIKSVMDYLATLRSPDEDRFYRLPAAPAPSLDNRWTTALPNHNEVFMQVKAYRLNGKFHWLRKGSQVPEGATPVEIPTVTDEKLWEQTALAFDFRPYGLNFWQLLKDDFHSGRSPIPGVSFQSFRRLGLAFWDRKRLWLLGLASGVNIKNSPSEAFYFFAWESILPPEEVACIKARARETSQALEAR
ncbi:hypothetical protein FPOAC2_11767 [Fusarium poae]|uniref:hypothetical protein n=1 Tax=Fusarium poae TaxID=36050 RepID=UPI001CE75A69|nr:hypothetical protein FPOAC1_011461 [Fusarium poae]KAG8666651.1 hypothetical protein FPOAC1_011461 [Fusarium poae]